MYCSVATVKMAVLQQISEDSPSQITCRVRQEGTGSTGIRN